MGITLLLTLSIAMLDLFSNRGFPVAFLQRAPEPATCEASFFRPHLDTLAKIKQPRPSVFTPSRGLAFLERPDGCFHFFINHSGLWPK
jgi:hypothetical protein